LHAGRFPDNRKTYITIGKILDWQREKKQGKENPDGE